MKSSKVKNLALNPSHMEVLKLALTEPAAVCRAACPDGPSRTMTLPSESPACLLTPEPFKAALLCSFGKGVGAKLWDPHSRIRSLD